MLYYYGEVQVQVWKSKHSRKATASAGLNFQLSNAFQWVSKELAELHLL
jgi:hypothetical protein